MRKINLFKQTIKLLLFILIMSTFSIAKAQNVLIIYDDSTTNIATASLADTLTEVGGNITFSDVPENLWDNTNPSLTDIDIVIHLNGTTYGDSMTIAGQLALVDFVENKGGYYIGSEWNGYEIEVGRMTEMQDLILLDRGNSNESNLNYVKDTSQSSHPVLDEVPDFTIDEASANGTVHVFDIDTCVVLMKEGDRDAVVVREFGNGKILGFHHAGNYNGQLTFANKNIQKIIINFIYWDKEYDTSTWVNELTDNSNILVFPNPSSGIINIQKDTENTFKTLSVIDLLGKNVYTSQLNPLQSEEQIDLSHLPKGIYLVTFKSDLESKTKKIIIK